MKILIRNNVKLRNRVLRFIKWKLIRLSRKFKHLHYAEVHLNTEGKNPLIYKVNLRLGVPGNDVILSNQSQDLNALLQASTKAAHRYLRKTKVS